VPEHGAVSADAWNHADRFERLEVEDGQGFSKAGTAGVVSVASRACVAPRRA
jgi:hypothetical protein